MPWSKSPASKAYSLFFRKLIQRFLLLGLMALVLLIMLYFLVWKEQLGDLLVYLLTGLGLSQEEAFSLYHEGFRAHRELYLALGLFMLFLSLLLLSFRWFYRYFEAIKVGIDQLLTEEDITPLPAELASVEAELVAAKTALRDRKEALLLANQRKQELVMYLAHDIRTPLTSVLGYLTYVRETPDLSDQDRKAYLDIAWQKAKRLESMMDDFFQLTKYQSGQLPLAKISGDLVYLIQQLADEFAPLLDQYDKELVLDLPDRAPMQMAADQLARALANLIKNAIVYSDDRAKICLSLTASPDSYRLQLTNPAQSLRTEEVERLFDKFYRADQSRSSQTGGTGLGLAISKEIIEAHGGSIKATSHKQQLTFVIDLPSS